MQTLGDGSVMCLVGTVDGGSKRLHPVACRDRAVCPAHGQRWCSEVAGDDEKDAVLPIAHDRGGGVDGG